MKKVLLTVMILTLVIAFSACDVSALTWCLGPSDCKSKAIVKSDVMGEPAELPTIAVLPSYTVGFNVMWLLKEKGLFSGPHMNVAKLANLVSIQGQYAMALVNDEESTEPTPNFYGLNGVVTIADLIKKLGGDPGEFILTFNPALGYTVGLKTDGRGFDHGPVVNVVNADLEKLCHLVGLCK